MWIDPFPAREMLIPACAHISLRPHEAVSCEAIPSPGFPGECEAIPCADQDKANGDNDRGCHRDIRGARSRNPGIGTDRSRGRSFRAFISNFTVVELFTLLTFLHSEHAQRVHEAMFI